MVYGLWLVVIDIEFSLKQKNSKIDDFGVFLFYNNLLQVVEFV